MVALQYVLLSNHIVESTFIKLCYQHRYKY
ncbi:hypothetical protein N476_01115 [Pseudoalteromonas luteoviolacea H33]|uniref:Uncharacterized protein n=1 Tax=Pseudoalteromonas luteoviolacea H33 TaxID=1365251 RepID=A0A167F9Y9_9GAMM|nr:hypothetical protein N476_01115 [Pseudoalteromonas luteoviolacea H33]KZN78671.1 hypothetical protein N477_07590 [Pseudoalteromonas luteoviolacea H33-S]